MSVNIVNKTTGDLTPVAGVPTDKVGNLNALTTTDKTSIVGGVNEIKSITDTCIKNGEAARISAAYLGEGIDGALVYTENGDVNFRTGSNGNYDIYTSIRKLHYSTTQHDIDNDYTFADLTAETNITWFTNWNDTVNFPVLYGSGVLIPAGDPSQKAIIYIGIGDTANGEVYTNIYKFGAWGGWKQLSFQTRHYGTPVDITSASASDLYTCPSDGFVTTEVNNASNTVVVNVIDYDLNVVLITSGGSGGQHQIRNGCNVIKGQRLYNNIVNAPGAVVQFIPLVYS